MGDFLEDIFGIKSGLDEVGDSLEKSAESLSRAVFASLNYWASLIEDYHSGDKQAQARARAVVAGVFGPQEEGGGKFEFNWDVRIEAEGFDTRRHPLRIMLLMDTPKTIEGLEATIRNAVRSDVNHQEIRGSVPPAQANSDTYAATVKELERRVSQEARALAKNLVNPPEPPTQLGVRDRPSAEELEKFRVGLFQSLLTNVVMAVVDRGIKLHASRGFVAFPWRLQPFLTILIPETDLAAQPDLKLYVTIHKRDKPEARIPQFRDEYEVSMSQLRSRRVTTTHDLGPTFHARGLLVNLT